MLTRFAALFCATAFVGCADGSATFTVTTPPKAPPPQMGAAKPAPPGDSEEGISVRRSAATPDVRVLRPATGCGIERWAVKTLTDPGASRVNLRPQSTTISALARIAPPKDPTDRLAPVETQTWQITNVGLVSFKQESDADIHLVVRDQQGRTMIVEFPSTPLCDATASNRHKARMAAARAAFVAACGPPRSSYRTIAGTATIAGVGFFDRIHGQRGVAPNGIELHPALSFRGTCRTA
jgi:hypothetical protein